MIGNAAYTNSMICRKYKWPSCWPHNSSSRIARNASAVTFRAESAGSSCKRSPRQITQAGYAEYFVFKYVGRTDRQFYPRTERRCTSGTAEPRLLQDCSKTGLPTMQRSRPARQAEPHWTRESLPRRQSQAFSHNQRQVFSLPVTASGIFSKSRITYSPIKNILHCIYKYVLLKKWINQF